MSILVRSLRLIKEKGLKEFLKRAIVFLDHKTGFVSILLLPYVVYRFRRMDLEETLKELFSDSLLGLLYRPMRVREEVESLLKILRELRPKYVLEIGTAHGGTLLLWTKVASEDATIISIDLPGGPFGSGYPWLRSLVYKAWTKDRQKIFLIRGDSHKLETLEKVEEVLKDSKLDFLFIDGDHTYEGVRRDFEMYALRVRKGGIIALHDIVPHPPETGCEVSKFWEEIKRRLKDYAEFMEIVKDWQQGWAGVGVILLTQRCRA